MDIEKDKITVFYDGACPKCVKDRCDYERMAGKSGNDVAWFDITGKDEELRALGINPRKALTELHVSDGRGNTLSELDAYILLMGRVPLLKPLAWFIGLPLIRQWVSRIYRRKVDSRLRREGRI